MRGVFSADQGYHGRPFTLNRSRLQPVEHLTNQVSLGSEDVPNGNAIQVEIHLKNSNETTMEWLICTNDLEPLPAEVYEQVYNVICRLHFPSSCAFATEEEKSAIATYGEKVIIEDKVHSYEW